MGLETALILGGVGAATSAAAASEQNRRLSASGATASRRLAETNRQLVERRNALVSQTLRARTNQQIQLDRAAGAAAGAARARAAAMGLATTSGSASRIITQTDLDRAYRSGLISQATSDQLDAIDSDYRSGVATSQAQFDNFVAGLANSAQSPFLTGLTSGLSFAGTGLSIAAGLRRPALTSRGDLDL